MGYIAPEQLEGDSVSAAADEYALACVVFECLTGHKPYERANDLAVVYSHLSEPPPSATAISGDLPPQLDPVIARGMAKDPADRYESCSALVAAVAEACGGTGPVVPTRPARGRRSARYLVAAGALVALAAGGVAVLLQRDGHHGSPAAGAAASRDAVAVLD